MTTGIRPFSRFRGRRRTPKPPRSPPVVREAKPSAASISIAKEQDHQNKVAMMLKDPELFAEFKRRMSETNNFSNAGACYVLHDFLEEMDVPGGAPKETYEVIPSPVPMASSWGGQGGSSAAVRAVRPRGRFRLLNSLRTSMTAPDPPSPDASYNSSPRNRCFSDSCPESPQTHISPTKTPDTPTEVMDEDDDSDQGSVLPKCKPNHPACLDQPNF